MFYYFIEAIIDSLLNKYLYLQIIPAIIGLFFINKIDSYFKCFILLLWYGVFNEVFSLYYGRHISPENYNQILYNIYNVVYFTFLFWLFYIKSKNLILKKTILVFSGFYVVSIGFEIIIQQKDYFSQTQVIPYIIGMLGVLICVFYYFLSVLVSNTKEKIYTSLLFWVAVAHFFYYLGFTPIKIGENYFNVFNSLGLFNLKIAITIIKSLIISIGFIICSRQKI